MRKFVSIAVFLIASTVMAAQSNQPQLAVAARLQTTGANPITALFSACGKIGTENDVIEMLTGDGSITLKFPGRLRTGDIVCSRLLNSDAAIWNWRRDIATGNFSAARRDGALVLLDSSGDEIFRWTFTTGWPSAYYIETKSTGVTETVVITTNSLVRNDGPIEPEITWPQPAAITYGTPLSATQLNAESSAPGSITYDPAAGEILAVGVHTLTANFTPTDATQYASATKTVQLTVLRAGLTVAADDLEKLYGAALPSLTYTISGFVNGDSDSVVSGSPTLSTDATASSNVGDYVIAISAGTLSAANYSFSYQPGTLTITRAPLRATAFDATRLYGSPNPIFEGELVTVVNNDNITVTFSTAATPSSAVGNYDIVPSLVDPDSRLGNYDVTLDNGVLTIEKAPLTVTANDVTIAYLQPFPPFTARYSGFVLNETEAVLSGAPAFSTPATPASLPGRYPIHVTLGTLSATNYSFAFVDGTLTIIGPRIMLENAAGLVGPLRDLATHPGDRNKLENVFAGLSAASLLARWQDELRPSRSEGQQIFQASKDAVVLLLTLLPTNQSGIPAATIRAIIDQIVTACRLVAVIAINDAQLANRDAKLIQKAREDLARGDSEAAANRPANAILEYRAAWARF